MLETNITICWRPHLCSPIGTIIATRYMVLECVACIISIWILQLTSHKSCVNKLDLWSGVVLCLPFTRFLTQFIFPTTFLWLSYFPAFVVASKFQSHSLSITPFFTVSTWVISNHSGTTTNELDLGLDLEMLPRDFMVGIANPQISQRHQEMNRFARLSDV